MQTSKVYSLAVGGAFFTSSAERNQNMINGENGCTAFYGFNFNYNERSTLQNLKLYFKFPFSV